MHAKTTFLVGGRFLHAIEAAALSILGRLTCLGFAWWAVAAANHVEESGHSSSLTLRCATLDPASRTCKPQPATLLQSWRFSKSCCPSLLLITILCCCDPASPFCATARRAAEPPWPCLHSITDPWPFSCAAPSLGGFDRLSPVQASPHRTPRLSLHPLFLALISEQPTTSRRTRPRFALSPRAHASPETAAARLKHEPLAASPP